MLEEQKKDTKEKLNISSAQKILLKVLVFLLPLAIFPFPWDWTERAMSLLILSIGTILLGLEIIKLIWEGKLSILKSAMDIGFFLILVSLLLSTVFSVDINTSLWGIDSRLGGGVVVFVVMLLLAIVSRSFIEGEEDVRSLIMFFLLGFFVNNVLSLLSFFGVNIWGLIPVYRNLYQSGLPLLRSSRVHILVNFVSVILCIGFIGEHLIDAKRKREFFLSLLIGFFSIINVWLYSVSVNLSLTLPLLGVVVLLLFFVLKTLKLDKETSKQIFLFSLICAFLIAIPVIFLQVPRVRESLFPEDFQLMNEITLGFDLSWIITGSVLVRSFFGGIFGIGIGAYSVAYHLFKPLDAGLLSLGDATFHAGVNEVLTKMTTGGLMWFLIWLFVGYLIVKGFISDLKSANIAGDKGGTWRFLMVDIVVLTIFFSSFLLSYSVLVMFLLLIFVSVRSVIREYLNKSTEDKFLLKFWALNMSSGAEGNSSLQNFNIFLTVIVAIATLVLFGVWGSKTLASLHILRSESYTVEANKKFVENPDLEPTQEEREEFLNTLDNFYISAYNLDKNNPLYNRKRTLIVLEKVRLLAESFSEVEEEETELRDQYINAIMLVKGEAVDLARESTDYAPAVYANWLTRSTLYTGLVGIGIEEHVTDSLTSLERAINLNPLNYQLYYSMAQIYIVKGEQENALGALSRVLEINPRHIPSIVLAADLYREAENLEMYAAYLQAAQQILEEEEATELEIYSEIVKALEALESQGVDLEQVPDAELPEGEGVEDPDLEEVGNGSSGDPVEEEGPFELDEEEPTL